MKPFLPVSVPLLPAILVIAALLFNPPPAHARTCPSAANCVQANSVAASPAERNRVAPLHNASQPTARPSESARGSPGGIDRNALLAWTIVAIITIAGLLVAIYPITFYLRQAWRSRQQTIFETLDAEAKRQYLQLYRASEATSGATVAEVEAAFSRVYYHWFGRGRLLTPTCLIGAVLLAYVFLAAIRAAEALLPAPTWHSPFTLPETALGAITGAYILVTMDTINRVVRRDLLPEDLQLTALRLISCVPFGYAFASLVQPNVAPFVALAITAIPLQQVAGLLSQLGSRQLGLTSPAAAGPGPDAPTQLAGVDQTVCERLSAIGVNTITQIAYSDPVQLTMRTSLTFIFVLDIVSQALAWVYLEQKLNSIRVMGLRGAYEIAALNEDAANGDDNAVAVMQQLPAILGITPEQCRNLFHQIADDPYAQFLVKAYG